ncbi:unnamed protein product [Macrosiphum euphorbiae]|uniref:Uncharacterized protein n=1 Tax=Macrosiphum euphorbiae TaxID=13131 RepID=A0AAV0XYC3_9HEMI|nr:unnamed protein product [Macrosiphum euphorbiae]
MGLDLVDLPLFTGKSRCHYIALARQCPSTVPLCSSRATLSRLRKSHRHQMTGQDETRVCRNCQPFPRPGRTGTGYRRQRRKPGGDGRGRPRSQI